MTWINAGKKPDAYAHNLYNNLRTLDRAQCVRILVQELPQDERWAAILDRLERASGGVGDGSPRALRRLQFPPWTSTAGHSEWPRLPESGVCRMNPNTSSRPDRTRSRASRSEHLVSRYGSPLFLIDAERVRAQYRSLAAALPGVDLFYAIKSLPHPAVVAVLSEAGGCFDLATNGEVQLVRRLGVAAERCIHTHPIKRDSDIRTALDFGVTHFVVDNEDELRKFVKYAAAPRC
jgi:hypothetical protein